MSLLDVLLGRTPERVAQQRKLDEAMAAVERLHADLRKRNSDRPPPITKQIESAEAKALAALGVKT